MAKAPFGRFGRPLGENIHIHSEWDVIGRVRLGWTCKCYELFTGNVPSLHFPLADPFEAFIASKQATLSQQT